MKALLEKIIPGHISDLGLPVRMINSKDSAAWFTILVAMAGLLLTPLDLFLQIFEQRFRSTATKPVLPIIIVCGAPRTGTTLASQILIKYLPVSYFNNFTAIFPRSPITVSRIIGRWIAKRFSYHSYYGKTQSFSGPNDAFYIWNQWMKEDESGVRCVLREEKIEEMQKFFGAYERVFNLPVLCKNNSLNTQAKAVAKAMPNTYFICMTREPEYLAQSLLQARIDINGDIQKSIWVDNPDKSSVDRSNYIEDVCDQVLYHEKKIAEQQQAIGAERFWIIKYEEFCRNPKKLVISVMDKILQSSPESMNSVEIEPFKISNRIKVEQNLFENLRSTIQSSKIKAA